MTPATLPAQDTVRWLPKRKASLVRALQAGLLTIDEACARYSVSIDELLSWERELARDGEGGLRVSRVQAHRKVRAERHPVPVRRRSGLARISDPGGAGDG